MPRARILPNGLPPVPGVKGYKPVVPLDQRKQVFLPKFTISLLRTPRKTPWQATFDVPLFFSKLDLRDYLARGYGVGVTSIRSYVEQLKPTRNRGGNHPGTGRWRRPQSKKRMTVELVEPFVWPAEPKDAGPWEKEAYHASRKEQQEFSEAFSPDAKLKAPTADRKAISQQAKELLKGKTTWKPTWQALGLGVKGINGHEVAGRGAAKK